MSNYTEYLNKSMGSRSETLTARREALTARLLAAKEEATRVQTAKAVSAPVVSGTGTSPVVNTNLKTGNKVTSTSKVPKASGKLGKKIIPTGGRVTQSWGGNKPQYSAGRHTGTDFGGAHGSAIKAAAGGTVTRVGVEGAYGNAIHIRHPDGKTTLYAHLSSLNVKKGQKVKSGQRIGGMGSTGNSSGTHLHFEVRSRDSYGGDINPYSWLKGR